MRLVSLLTVVALLALGGLVATSLIRPTAAAGGSAGLATASDVAGARRALARIQERLTLESVLATQLHRARPHPERLDPAWFPDGVPRNPCISDAHPWVEIASEDERGRLHPRSIVAIDERHGAFWYDPSAGLLRARAPAGMLDVDAINLYNAMNDADVDDVLP